MGKPIYLPVGRCNKKPEADSEDVDGRVIAQERTNALAKKIAKAFGDKWRDERATHETAERR